jgi:actin-like ATPase involved in cell morphogenesis
VTEYLRSANKVAIGSTELDSIKKELESTKAGAEAETKKQVAIVASSMKSQYENEIKLIQEQNKTAAAENASKIGVLAEKNFMNVFASLGSGVDCETLEVSLP